MTIFVPGPTSRRAFLAGVTGLVAAARIPRVAAEDSKPVKEFKLTATAGRVALVGKPHPDTNVWCYDGRVPGPEIRLRQGEPARIIVQNNLTEGTTVHWHGIRLPIAMDGVPDISQSPIRPGESFVYEFTPPDAGTFWYHPHADSLQQLGRGMAGALIVEEPQPFPVDRDVLWMLADWRLTAKQRHGSFDVRARRQYGHGKWRGVARGDGASGRAHPFTPGQLLAGSDHGASL